MEIKKRDISAKFDSLQQDYSKKLKGTAQRLSLFLRAVKSNQLTAAHRNNLRATAHKLAGSAGSFGFAEVSEYARALENIINTGADNDDASVTSALAALIVNINSAKPGTRPPGIDDAKAPLMHGEISVTNPKLLIADDDDILLKALRRRCEAIGFEVETVTDGMDAITSVYDKTPDVIVLDINMPVADGFSVCEKLLAHDKYRYIPMLFLTGQTDEEVVSRCAELGASYVLKDAHTWENLKQALSDLLGLHASVSAAKVTSEKTPSPHASPIDSAQPTLLAVDDDPDMLHLLEMHCEAMGLNFVGASSPNEGFIKALQVIPDVITLDYMMPEGTGLYLIQRIRNTELTKTIPVIFLTGEALQDSYVDYDLVMRLRRQEGVAAYLQKPLNITELHYALTKNVGLMLPPLTMATRRAAAPQSTTKRLFGG